MPRSNHYAPLSICPEERRGWLGHPGLIGTDVEGRTLSPRFSITDVKETSGTLIFRLECVETGLALVQTIELFAETDMVVVSACLEAGEPGAALNWLSACALPVADHVDRIVDFSGRWLGEFQVQETPWNVGTHVRESREGRTGHAHFPGMVLPAGGAGNVSGEVYALHLGWSGGHCGFAEETPDGRRQVQMGASLKPGEIVLSAGEVYATPPLFATFSAKGANGAMAAFHRHALKHVVRFRNPDRARPVHYNCWEAIYFDHDIETLKDIAAKAAALGAERFVLDDGWFRGRTGATAGLGDWVVDPDKYPGRVGAVDRSCRRSGHELRALGRTGDDQRRQRSPPRPSRLGARRACRRPTERPASVCPRPQPAGGNGLLVHLRRRIAAANTASTIRNGIITGP